MRVSLIQSAVDPKGPATNLKRVEQILAGTPQSDLYLLPELWSTGYDHAIWPSAADTSTPSIVRWMAETAEAKDAVVAGSLVSRRQDGKLVNRMWWCAPDGSISTYDKAHLFSPLREDLHLMAGTASGRVEFRGWNAALSLCYDLRFPEQYRADALAGARLFVVSAAWPNPRCLAMRTLAMARAIENQSFLLLCNRSGPGENGSTYCGRSMVVDPTGTILGEAGVAEELLTVEIGKSALSNARQLFDSLADRNQGVDRIV